MPEFDLIHVREDGSITTSMRCTSCPLSKEPQLVTNCMEGSGTPGSTFLLAGHQPGREDDGIGRSFTGKNGRLLRQMMNEADWDIDDCFFTNTLKCSLYDNKPRDSYWKKCRGHFRQELELVKPQAIVSFGGTALKWLTGFAGVRRFRRRGLPCVFDPEIVVYPFEQAISIDHYKGREFYRARARFIKDLLWLKQKQIDGTLRQTDDIPTDYKHATTIEDVRSFLAEFPEGSLVYADLETCTEAFEMAVFPYPGNMIAAIGFSKGPGHARTIPFDIRGLTALRFWKPEQRQEIFEMLRPFWQTHKFTGHNWAQFDHKWVSMLWDIEALDIPFESMLASHLMDEEPGGHGLETLALRYSKMMPWKKMFTVKDVTRCQIYLAKDVDGGSRVYAALNAKISKKLRWLHENIQLPLALEARRMEQRGVMIDVEAMETLGRHLKVVMVDAEKEFRTDARVQAYELKNGPIGFDNPHHMRDLMENYFKLDCIKRTETGLYSADAEVLEYWEDDVFVLQPYLRRRRASKLFTTYYSNIKTRVDEHGPVIHYSMKIHGTVTGRPSFSDPNVGNIPREDTADKAGIEDPKIVKAMFIPRPGRVFLNMDYSQAESRVLAILADDKNMMQIFFDGQDIHSATAATVYGIPIDEFMRRLKAKDGEVKGYRSDAKKINFGIPYGKSEESLVLDFVVAARLTERKEAKKAGRDPNFTPEMEKIAEEQGKNFLRLHKKNYPDVWKWLARQEQLIRSRGYLETPFNRRRRFYKIDNAAIRQAFNFPIQCLHPETLVMTRRGQVPLKDIRQRDTVHDGHRWVGCKMHGPRLKDEYKLVLSNGLSILCSGDHQFKTITGWKKAKAFTRSDQLIQQAKCAEEGSECLKLKPSDYEEFNRGGRTKPVGPIKDYEELFWLFGLMVGDGTYSKPNSTLVVVNYTETAIAARVRGVLARNSIHSRETVTNYRGRPSYLRFGIGTAFYRVMERFGFPMASFEKKDICPQLLSLLPRYRCAFLRGLFDADGGMTGSAENGFSLNLNIVAPALSRNTVRLLHTLGIYARTKRYKTSHRDVWRVIVPPSECETFSQRVGFTEPRKQRLLDVIVAYHDCQSPGPRKDGLYRVRPVSIKKTGRRVKMLDLEVFSREHAFGVSGVVVHNSTAAELTHISLVRCAKILRALEIDAYPVLTVYDSIVFSCTPENMWEVAEIAKDIMETLDQDYPWMTVPMKVDAEAGPSWGRLREIDLEKMCYAD